MTIFQRLLYGLGFWRVKRYRRWIGGRWAECCSKTTHSPAVPRWRWKPDMDAHFDEHTHAIEQWPSKLPKARVARDAVRSEDR
jgi:hypothetical protein